MRAPLGTHYQLVRKGTHATPWPYLARLMPKPLRSIGLGSLDGARRYRPGPEVSVAVADCQGLHDLAGPGRWSIAALLVADGDVAAEVDRLGRVRYGAWHRGPGGEYASPGFERWEERQLEVTLPIHPESPIRAEGRRLTVCLSASLGTSEFWWDIHTLLSVVAVHALVDTPRARERLSLLALDPSTYRRETARGAELREAAIDLMFFRPHFDADALVSLVEAVVSAHLLDLVLTFLREGFVVPPEVQASTQEYRDEMDPVGQFLNECVRPKPGNRIQAMIMYQAYQSWSEVNAKTALAPNKFGRVLKGRLAKDEKSNRHAYLDCELVDVPEAPAKGTWTGNR